MDDSVLEGYRLMGATPAQLAEVRAKAERQAREPTDDTYGIWEENWSTWQLFLALSSQWEYLTTMVFRPAHAGGGGHTRAMRKGLPADRIESEVRLHGHRRSTWPQLIADVRAMEQAVLKVDRERPRE